MKGKVLITGASGFLGFHLIETALKNNLEVYAGIRKTSNIRHLQHLPLHFTPLDLSRVDSLQENIQREGYDYIVHAAGVTTADSAVQYNKVNADFAYNLILAAKQADVGLEKFVQISSLAAIGPLDDPNEVIKEQTPPHPVTLYGKSKLLSESRLQTVDLPLVILRPTAIYGPRDAQFLVLFKSFKRGLEPYIGKLEQRLSFVYVKDVAQAAIGSLFKPATGAYNLSDGKEYTRYAMAGYTKAYFNKKTVKFHLPYGLVRFIALSLEKTEKIFQKAPLLNEDKLNELTGRNWICSIEKAEKELSFNPAYPLKEGVDETLTWYKENGWL